MKVQRLNLQLYNEDLYDLLSHERTHAGLRIHEDSNGEIYLDGVTRVTVTSPSQVCFAISVLCLIIYEYTF